MFPGTVLEVVAVGRAGWRRVRPPDVGPTEGGVSRQGGGRAPSGAEGAADQVFVERAARVMDRKLNREAKAFADAAHKMVCQQSGDYRVLVGDRAEEALSFSMESERDGKTITAFLPLNIALHVLEDVADMLVVHKAAESARPWRKRFASEWAKVNRERQKAKSSSEGPHGV